MPFFFHEPLTGEVLAQVFASNRGQPFMLRHQHSGVNVMVNPGRYGPQILRLIDGIRSFGEIFDQFRADWRGKAPTPDNALLFTDFAESYDTLNALDRLLLRHPASGSRRDGLTGNGLQAGCTTTSQALAVVLPGLRMACGRSAA